MVKEGAAVIDVGINYVHDPVTGKTKLVGDVDFEGNKLYLLISKEKERFCFACFDSRRRNFLSVGTLLSYQSLHLFPLREKSLVVLTYVFPSFFLPACLPTWPSFFLAFLSFFSPFLGRK